MRLAYAIKYVADMNSAVAFQRDISGQGSAGFHRPAGLMRLH